MNCKLPLYLEKCPLVDALIEVRFETTIIGSAIFGIIYNLIQDDYKNSTVTNLPILQIPEQIRKNDPDLKFKPLYRIESEQYVIQIGDNVLCISSKIPYVGWKELSKRTKNLIEKISEAKIISRISRIGHRYVNFFEGDIIDKLTISRPSIKGYQSNNILIRTEVKEDDDFIDVVQITNSAIYKPPHYTNQISGSIIDIDSSKEYKNNYFLENLEAEINKVHICEKKIFYSLLSEDLLNSLNPTY